MDKLYLHATPLIWYNAHVICRKIARRIGC